MKRIKSHPLFNIPTSNKEISFSYNGKTLKGKTTDTVVSALLRMGLKFLHVALNTTDPEVFTIITDGAETY